MSANPTQTQSKPRPILNIADVELQPRPPQFAPKGAAAERYAGARMGLISPRLGATKLGYSITAIASGKRAFPFHNHHANEEMFYIIEGAGELRMGDATYPVRAGDIVACPCGGKELAHQFINTGNAELKYLGVSTKIEPDVCEYPDSGKIGVLGNAVRYLGHEDAAVDYWEGE